MRVVWPLLIALSLSGCFCTPEKGDAVDKNYFSNCWNTAKYGHRDQPGGNNKRQETPIGE